MSSRDESDSKFDWNRTWVKEMFMSSEDAVRHKAELERLQGITPESKRLKEVKAGVITASAGAGLMLVLSVIMEGIIISGRLSDLAAEILSRVWIVGVIPLLIGLALVFNGTVVSRRRQKQDQDSHATDAAPIAVDPPANVAYLSPADTNQLNSAVPYSIVDETTKNLVKEKR
jgi:hypothetical protein